MNTRYIYLESALSAAIEAGHQSQAIRLVDILLEENEPEVFANKDDNGRNFLQLALLAGMPTLIRKLLNVQIANPDIPVFSNRDKAGATSFLLATLGYNTNELLEELTAFCRRCPSSSPEQQMWLIADNNGYTPLHQLVKRNRYHAAAWLIEYIAPELAHLYQDPKSTHAISSKRESLRRRMDAGEAILLPYINHLSMEGTALHTACAANPVCVDIVVTLINNGAELYHLQDTKCRTAFDLLLSLPPETLITIFSRLHPAQQNYLISHCENGSEPGILLQSLVMPRSYDVQNDLGCYLPPYEHAAMKQYHSFYQDIDKLNRINNQLSIWIDDLNIRPQESRRAQIILASTTALLLILLYGGYFKFMLSNDDMVLSDFLTLPHIISTAINFLFALFLITCITMSKLALTRISSTEWKDLFKEINENILVPLQMMEAENIDALPVPPETIRALEVQLSAFKYRLIPHTLQVIRDAAVGLQAPLNQVKQGMINSRKSLTFFQPAPPIAEVRLELSSDEERTNNIEMVELLQSGHGAPRIY